MFKFYPCHCILDELILLYGMPHSGIPPQQPDLTSDEFSWAASMLLIDQFNSFPQELVPPTPFPSPDPQKIYYPTSQKYTLVKTDKYRCGCVYYSDFSTSAQTKETLSQRLHHIRTPPGVNPILVDGKYVVTPIPGMIQATPGVPIAQYLNDDSSKLITVCCLHTLSTISEYPEGHNVKTWATELYALTFGEPACGDSPGRTPVYATKLKRNLRSGEGNKNRYLGSFSLAVTKGEGQGNGVIIPTAQQMLLQDEQDTISRILLLLSKINTVVLSCSISRFELKMIEFNNLDNNIFSFGTFGSESHHTGCQLNVSSGTADLWDTIGNLQGSWHSDRNDCIFRFTCLTLLFRLPPGMTKLPVFNS